jgi:hypothetical protein
MSSVEKPNFYPGGGELKKVPSLFTPNGVGTLLRFMKLSLLPKHDTRVDGFPDISEMPSGCHDCPSAMMDPSTGSFVCGALAEIFKYKIDSGYRDSDPGDVILTMVRLDKREPLSLEIDPGLYMALRDGEGPHWANLITATHFPEGCPIVEEKIPGSIKKIRRDINKYKHPPGQDLDNHPIVLSTPSAFDGIPRSIGRFIRRLTNRN